MITVLEVLYAAVVAVMAAGLAIQIRAVNRDIRAQRALRHALETYLRALEEEHEFQAWETEL